MPISRLTKNQFTSGEIAPKLYGRADLSGYEHGARLLRNVLIHPTGGLSRRPGLARVAALPGQGRLLPFVFNAGQFYLLVLLDHVLQVWRDGSLVASLAAPWSLAQIKGINWVQNADTMFIVHREVPPQRITRMGVANWRIEAFTFSSGTDYVNQPYFKFAPNATTLTPSSTSGTITLSASADVFDAGQTGLTFRLQKREVVITAVRDARTAEANVRGSLVDTAATDNWEEAAFSARRGWPGSVALYQGRLAFAGSRDLPNRIWMSRTDEIDNFSLGKGLDDEGVEFALIADSVDDIRSIRGARHLQVFTSDAEWVVTSEPITPAKVLARRQTHIGSPSAQVLPPIEIDGATYFVSGGGEGIYEFLYGDVEQKYTTSDMTLLSSHLFGRIVAMAYDKGNRLLFTVLEDGTAPVLTIYRAEQVSAWSVLETAGRFESVAEVGGEVFFIVERNGQRWIERLDAERHTDASHLLSFTAPLSRVSGLNDLEGGLVALRVDGRNFGTAKIVDGAVDLPAPGLRVEVGLPFVHRIEPLPSVIGGDGAIAVLPHRMVRANFRLSGTMALRVDAGLGLRPVPFRRLGASQLDRAIEPYSGDVEVRGIGWVRGGERPLWRIEQDEAHPFTLNAVITEEKGAD